jgi:hypothetical protein
MEYTFNINNTRDEDGRFIYPSNFIQSDEDVILNKAKGILTSAGATIEQ